MTSWVHKSNLVDDLFYCLWLSLRTPIFNAKCGITCVRWAWYLNDAAEIKQKGTLRWSRHESKGLSSHRRLDGLLNLLFRCRSKKTSKLRVTVLCEGNHRWTVDSPHKGPVRRTMFPFDDVIMNMTLEVSQYFTGSPWPFCMTLSSQRKITGTHNENGVRTLTKTVPVPSINRIRTLRVDDQCDDRSCYGRQWWKYDDSHNLDPYPWYIFIDIFFFRYIP